MRKPWDQFLMYMHTIVNIVLLSKLYLKQNVQSWIIGALLLKKDIGSYLKTIIYNVNGENESMEEVDMDGSKSDQELTGNETDWSEWASKVREHVWSMLIWSRKHRY